MTNPRHTLNVLALLLLPALCLVGLIGNALVCIAISTDRRLHNVTNYFLFSLALADLLVCCIVMPLSIVVEVRHGVWTWNVSLCLLYVYADVFLCSASIVHMSVISLDRYLGISQPLRTRNKSKTMILTKIALVWFITLLVSSPIAVLAVIDNTNILRENTCTIFSQYYIIYGSTLTFLIPFGIMAVTYVRTTNLLNKQASILSQRANDKLNGNGLRRTIPHRKLGYVRTNSTSTNGFTSHGTHKSSSNSNGPKTSIASFSNSYQHSLTDADMTKLITLKKSKSQLYNGHAVLTKTSTINRWKSRTSNYLSSIASRVSRRSSLQAASQELANEHKATRVLAVVFICFFICWTPFFIANFIMGFCGATCAPPSWLGSLFLWLGYISSTINPIIYTVFNKRFRQAFVRILRCQCFHPLRDQSALYSRNFTTVIPDTYTWSNHERMISVNGKEETNATENLKNGCDSSWQRQNSNDSEASRDKKDSSQQPSLDGSALRDSRATTEETSDEDIISEQKPLIPPRVYTSVVIRKSFTTLISSSSISNSDFPKSASCIDCQRCRCMIDSTDTETTMSSSINSCPQHLTLFSSAFGKQIKETFL
ncbi:unnamed protein product [Auanema sp. JU1783]|nr:unnamed protein product [Auanema sp. JU1783]